MAYRGVPRQFSQKFSRGLMGAPVVRATGYHWPARHGRNHHKVYIPSNICIYDVVLQRKFSWKHVGNSRGTPRDVSRELPSRGFPRDVLLSPRLPLCPTGHVGIQRVLAGSHGGKKVPRDTVGNRSHGFPWGVPRTTMGCDGMLWVPMWTSRGNPGKHKTINRTPDR